jgi:hypothetical protein
VECIIACRAHAIALPRASARQARFRFSDATLETTATIGNTLIGQIVLPERAIFLLLFIVACVVHLFLYLNVVKITTKEKGASEREGRRNEGMSYFRVRTTAKQTNRTMCSRMAQKKGKKQRNNRSLSSQIAFSKMPEPQKKFKTLINTKTPLRPTSVYALRKVNRLGALKKSFESFVVSAELPNAPDVAA